MTKKDAPPLEAPKSSLCVFKQYVGDIKKPLHLHGAETLQITLSGSLAFVVALAWNDFFREGFLQILKRIAVSDSTRKLMYAMIATLVLFSFNMSVGAAITCMRNRAQHLASVKANRAKKDARGGVRMLDRIDDRHLNRVSAR